MGEETDISVGGGGGASVGISADGTLRVAPGTTRVLQASLTVFPGDALGKARLAWDLNFASSAETGQRTGSSVVPLGVPTDVGPLGDASAPWLRSRVTMDSRGPRVDARRPRG